MTIFSLIFFLSLFLLYRTIVVVPTRYNFVIERLGKFRKVLEPGWYILIPFLDRVAYRQDIREQVIRVEPQHCITQDNIQVIVDGFIYLKIFDSYKASYGIFDYTSAIVNLGQTMMRSEVGKRDLGSIFYERETLNEKIVSEIDNASDAWGVKVLRYELFDISPSEDVVHTLEIKMEAERSRRAEVTLANATKEEKRLISEGERQQAINISKGEQQRLTNVAEGNAEAMKLVAKATADGLRKVGQAIEEPGGSEALKLRLTEEYIANLSKLLVKSKIKVYPMDLGNLKGIWDTLGGALNNSDIKR